MGLRAKLPTTFLVLLATAIIAVGAICLDRMLRLMAHGVVVSADLCGKDVFEQVREALEPAGWYRPRPSRLRNDHRLCRPRSVPRSRSANTSSTSRIVSIDGKDLVGSDTTDTAADVGKNKTVLSDHRSGGSFPESPWPLSLVQALWSDHVYELEPVL